MLPMYPASQSTIHRVGSEPRKSSGAVLWLLWPVSVMVAMYKDTFSISKGAFDGPTGMKPSKHIFVADKGDNYDISEDLPQEEQ